MKQDMVMPKMGESITEGTIIKWLKNVGDTVEYEITKPATADIAPIRVKITPIPTKLLPVSKSLWYPEYPPPPKILYGAFTTILFPMK